MTATANTSDRGQASARRSWTPAIVIAAAVLLVALAATAWARFRPLPSPDADPVTLAKFVSTSRFERLSDHKRRPYMRTLRVRTDQLASAYRAGQITRSEYEQAYFCGWMDRQIDHMRNYYRQLPGKREQYLRDEHLLKLKQPAKLEAPVPPHEAEVEFISRWTSRWPAETKAEWDEFRAASKRIKASIAGANSATRKAPGK